MSTLYPTLERFSAELPDELPELISKIAIAQVRTLPTRLEENVEIIKAWIDRAESQGAELVVFPELTIPGYVCLDHFRNPEFIRLNLEALEEVVSHTKQKKIIAIVGFADSSGEDPGDTLRPIAYNSAAVICNGAVFQIVDKALLPEYDVFSERRYFLPAREVRAVKLGQLVLGVEICEDLWESFYPEGIVSEFGKENPQLLVNLSASPFHPNKLADRMALIREAQKSVSAPFVYVNLVGSQDGYEGELVFDGESMVVSSDGQPVAIATTYYEELLVVDLKSSKPVELPVRKPVAEVFGALVMGIREYLNRCGFERAYIGLSGGIDSALTAALAVEALGNENVIGVTMPSHITSDETRGDAIKLAEALGIRVDQRPIAEQYEAWKIHAEKAHKEPLNSLTVQNIQARIRGQILMEYTNQDSGSIVISTGNKTELALGYCTLYGDMCGGLAAISDVNKLMVYQLSEYYNKLRGREIIPQSIIDRVPTAELEEDQEDRENLPADYPVLAPLVERIVEGAEARVELIKDFPEDVVDSTLRLISLNEYKRRQAPPGIRVSTKAFGIGRRIPIDDRYLRRK